MSAGVVVIIAVVAGVLLAAWVTWRREVIYVRKAFSCPESGRIVDCEIVRDVRTGRWGDVIECSARRDPDHEYCRKACVDVLNLGIDLERKEGG